MGAGAALPATTRPAQPRPVPPRLPACPPAEDALKIFEQGAALPEPHAPLLAAWAELAVRMGRRELVRRIEAIQAAAARAVPRSG